MQIKSFSACWSIFGAFEDCNMNMFLWLQLGTVSHLYVYPTV